MAEFLEMRGIVKRFPGVLALDHVNLSVRKGEVHALLGENGAGKSTLMKILSGAYTMDEGEILFDGKKVEIHSAQDAQALNISTIYQELNLTEQLTVAENIFMGRQLMKNRFQVDWKRMYDEAQRLLDELGVDVNAHQLVRDLGVAHKQMVEVAKALSINSKVLILDEPTAPLTNREIDVLFNTIRMLKARGVSMIYISHRLEEVMEICDRATIMRDGQFVTAMNVADTNLDEIIRYMVGRELKEKFPKIHLEPGKERLRVENIHAGKQVNGVSLSARGGEILGIAGLVGAGRTETARAIFGMDPKDIKAGIGFVTEDRKGEGLVLPLPISQNMTLATLDKLGSAVHMNLGQEKSIVNEYIGKLNIKTPSMLQLARNLSGGNQQKVGGAGQVAAVGLQGHHIRRAHPRHRRRREDRGLQHHQRPDPPGRGRHHDLLGAARGAGHVRPGGRHASGRNHRRVRQRRHPHPGKDTLLRHRRRQTYGVSP